MSTFLFLIAKQLEAYDLESMFDYLRDKNYEMNGVHNMIQLEMTAYLVKRFRGGSNLEAECLVPLSG